MSSKIITVKLSDGRDVVPGAWVCFKEFCGVRLDSFKHLIANINTYGYGPFQVVDVSNEKIRLNHPETSKTFSEKPSNLISSSSKHSCSTE